MIKGMTGFGTTQLSSGDVKVVIEIKSVNHRYLDINYYLPVGFGAIENKIRDILKTKIVRGRLIVSVKILEKPAQTVALNKNIIKKYIRHAKQIQKEFGVDDDLSLSTIIKLPGVFDVKEKFLDAKSFWPSLEKGVYKTLKSLLLMRSREGRSLMMDIKDKARNMSKQIKVIHTRLKSILKLKKNVLSEEEYTSFQKNIDINEELIRLAHYIEEVKILIKSTTSVGKKIDFLAQEMQRETNTIGSKLQDKMVTNAVISLKSKIEKIREQAQNIE